MELTEETLGLILAKLGPALMMSLAAIGGGVGFIGGAEGVCKAAEYTVSVSFSLIPVIFITAPMIYVVIVFFMVYDKGIETLADGLVVLSACLINGIASGITGYSVGYAAKVACVARAQQKKFNTIFFLILIFGEAVGLLGLVCAIAVATGAKK